MRLTVTRPSRPIGARRFPNRNSNQTPPPPPPPNSSLFFSFTIRFRVPLRAAAASV